LILLLEGLAGYVIVTAVISRVLRMRGLRRQRRVMMFLEGYILAGLIFSTLNLMSGSYVVEVLSASPLEVYLSFLLHLGLVPYAWVVLIKKVR